MTLILEQLPWAEIFYIIAIGASFGFGMQFERRREHSRKKEFYLQLIRIHSEFMRHEEVKSWVRIPINYYNKPAFLRRIK